MNPHSAGNRSASPFLSDYQALCTPLSAALPQAHAQSLSHTHMHTPRAASVPLSHALQAAQAPTPLSASASHSQSFSSFSSSPVTSLSLSMSSSSHSSHNNYINNNHHNNYYQYDPVNNAKNINSNTNINNAHSMSANLNMNNMNMNNVNNVNSSAAVRPLPLPVPPVPVPVPLQESNDLFVGDLSFFCTDEALLSLFSEYCDVERAHVVRTQDGSRSRTFGFVTLAFPQQRESVAALMNGQLFMGRLIRVELVDKNRPNAVKQRELAGYELHVSFSASTRAPIVTEMVLRRVFMRFGVILDVVARDFHVNKELGLQQGYAFVAFADLSIALSLLFRSFSAQGMELKCTAGHKIQQYIQQRASHQQQQQQPREEDALYSQVPWPPRQEMSQQPRQQPLLYGYERENVRESGPHTHTEALHRSSMHSVSLSPPLPSPRLPSSSLPLSSFSEEREREKRRLLDALLTSSTHENNTLSSLFHQEQPR